MAKKKGVVSSFVKLAAVKKKKARKNPTETNLVKALLPTNMEFVFDAGTGVIGYAGTALAAKVGSAILASKTDKPWVRHTPPVIGVGAFALLWWITSRWAPAKKYQTPILVGAGIAVAHTIIKTWLPNIAWMLGIEASKSMTLAPIAARSTSYDELEGDLTSTVDADSDFDDSSPIGDDTEDDLSGTIFAAN